MLPHETEIALYAAFVFLAFGFLMMFITMFNKMNSVSETVNQLEEEVQTLTKQNEEDGFILRRVKIIEEEGETVDFDNE
jgi:uncharacterized protein YoxC